MPLSINAASEGVQAGAAVPERGFREYGSKLRSRGRSIVIPMAKIPLSRLDNGEIARSKALVYAVLGCFASSNASKAFGPASLQRLAQKEVGNALERTKNQDRS